MQHAGESAYERHLPQRIEEDLERTSTQAAQSDDEGSDCSEKHC